MEGILNMIRQPYKTEKNDIKANNKEIQSLIDEIRDVCRQMDQTEVWFQMESNSDLIDACIYQREVLKARYRYLISQARLQNIYSHPFMKNLYTKGEN